MRLMHATTTSRAIHVPASMTKRGMIPLALSRPSPLRSIPHRNRKREAPRNVRITHGLPKRFCGPGSQPRNHAAFRRSRITAAVEKDAAFAKDLEGTVMTDSEMENVTAAGGLRQSHKGVRGPRQPRQASGVAGAADICHPSETGQSASLNDASACKYRASV
jgi:hypothetical protein